MIQAVVVEDEPLARGYLVALLARTGRVDVVGEAEDAREGLRLCARPGVDAAFLDVRLPGPDGLTLAGRLTHLSNPPLLVFVTGSADYAVPAFRVHATDYLLKPLEPRQVEEAVRHLEQRLQERRGGPNSPQPSDTPDAPPGEKLPVRDRGRDVARLLARREVVAVLRRGRRTWIHTTDAEYPSYYPLARVDPWLGGAPFLRVAREAIVNMEAVVEILHYGDRLYRLRLRDRRGTVVQVSRSGAQRLAPLLRPRL
jgi:two-component system, LytTR family, response regulator LytT